MVGLIKGCVALAAMLMGGQEFSDADLLAMGRDRWIQRHLEAGADYDTLRNAERRHSLALGLRKERQIKESVDAKLLDEIDLDFANMTKGACRVADYQFEGKPEFLLINSKAEALMVLTMDAIVNRRPSSERVTQAEVWETFKSTRAYHEGQKLTIASFAQRGGYPLENFFQNYDGLGHTAARIIAKLSTRSADEKQHAFAALVKLLRLTRGEDPLPYPR